MKYTTANRILCAINWCICGICSAALGVTLWAIAIHPMWQLVIIALCTLLLADIARMHAINLWRKSQSLKTTDH